MRQSTEDVLREFMLYQAQFNKDLTKTLETLAEIVYRIDNKIDVKTGKKSLTAIVADMLN
tara:strand:+ start:2526 stop:2705 length:180 start_codon:yes stop_codon:yes gene_type:complete